jgi:hypothetical protein
MRSFGVWLWQNRDQGSDVQRLRTVAAELGPDWPIESVKRADYEAIIANAKQDPLRTALIQALGRVWPAYEAENARAVNSGGWAGLGNRLMDYASNIGVWGVALGGLLLIVLLFKSFDVGFLNTIANVEAARGLITFLFAIVTVGIAVVVVLAVLLSNATNEELAERYQRGKDVLTILIGVFGAILGFYFGSEAQESVEQQVAALRQEVATLRQAAGAQPIVSTPDSPDGSAAD